MASSNQPSKPTEDLRTIRCVHCDREQPVARRAISAVCKFCHKRLKLDDGAAGPGPLRASEDLHTIRCVHCRQPQQVARRAISAVCKFCHKAMKFDGSGGLVVPSAPAKAPEEVRTVTCMHCDQEQPVARRAISAVCRFCHKPMKLDEGATAPNPAAMTSEEQQTISCVHCHQSQLVPRRALSATCRHCHKALKFDAIAIKAYEAKRQIATCGVVTVEKNGNAIVDSIKCTGLVVRGKVKGNIECMGPVAFGPRSEVKGDVTAPTLQVDAGAVLEGQYEIGQRPLEAPAPAA
jgi:hypothetical protein